jgi:hypothetical protein
MSSADIKLARDIQHALGVFEHLTALAAAHIAEGEPESLAVEETVVRFKHRIGMRDLSLVNSALALLHEWRAGDQSRNRASVSDD